METTTGEHLTPENIMEPMLKLKGICIEVEKAITDICKKLRREEVRRKKQRERDTNLSTSSGFSRPNVVLANAVGVILFGDRT